MVYNVNIIPPLLETKQYKKPMLALNIIIAILVL